jgi:undecaprenyl diphosphate synthase
MSLTAENISQYPTHVAIVPDGNGRWATKRGLPRLSGHREGLLNMLRMVQYINEYPIKYVTFYIFSTENWNRPEAEVNGLFKLGEHFVSEQLQKIHEKNIRIIHLGRMQGLPENLQNALHKSMSLTAGNTGLTLCLALNYGGKAEIVDAIAKMETDPNRPQSLDEQSFSRYLYTTGIPDVDLLIRTADEKRLSNFLLWQAAYSELYFSDVFWPDFGKEEIEKALIEFNKRTRRYGGL